MAGIVVDTDAQHHRIFTLWREGGLEFRSNIVTEVGGSIPLHCHEYDHVALVTHGRFMCVMVSPEGEESICTLASKDFDGADAAYRLVIRAFWKHQFTLLEMHQQPGEILCIFPSAREGN